MAREYDHPPGGIFIGKKNVGISGGVKLVGPLGIVRVVDAMGDNYVFIEHKRGGVLAPVGYAIQPWRGGACRRNLLLEDHNAEPDSPHYLHKYNRIPYMYIAQCMNLCPIIRKTILWKNYLSAINKI